MTCNCKWYILASVIFSSVQFSPTVMPESLWPDKRQQTKFPYPSPTPGVYPNSSIESVLPSNDLILYCPLLLLPSIFPRIRVFSNELALPIRWPKYWSFINPSNEHPGLIFRMHWLDLLQSKGRSKSSPTPQFKNINSSALSFLYSQILTTIHDYWKNNSLH